MNYYIDTSSLIKIYHKEAGSRKVMLYVFDKKVLGQIKGISFKIKDQVLDSAFSISSDDSPDK